MKLLVHTGTGTFFEIDDGVYIVDTDNLNDEEVMAFIEGWDKDLVDITLEKGQRVLVDDLPLE